MLLLARIWHLLLPTPCLWCSLPVQHFQRQLCDSCQHALPAMPYQLCHYNLLYLPQVTRGLANTKLDALLSVGYYQQPYRHWLQRWKFAQDFAAGKLLLQLFATLLRQYQQQGATLPEAIVYVPMHPAKHRKRGFNPAQLLAEHAAKQLNIPVLAILRRPLPNKAQVSLNRQQRLKNLRSAFTLAADTTVPANIALVDDVITTGATANALCRILRRAGAKHISLWTIAVTLAD